MNLLQPFAKLLVMTIILTLSCVVPVIGNHNIHLEEVKHSSVVY